MNNTMKNKYPYFTCSYKEQQLIVLKHLRNLQIFYQHWDRFFDCESDVFSFCDDTGFDVEDTLSEKFQLETLI